MKRETLAQLFYCEFCEISKNTFLYRTALVAASASDDIMINLNWPKKEEDFIWFGACC